MQAPETYKGHQIVFWRRQSEGQYWYSFTIDSYQYPRAFSEPETARWVMRRVIDDNLSEHWGRSR